MKVTKYTTLAEYAEAFQKGNLNLIILVGRPGTSKSQTWRNTVMPDACWIEGNASAFGLYRQLYEHVNQPIVIDDVDGLAADRNSVRLLKSLCQNEPVKTLQWKTAAAGKGKLPDEFRTTSHVTIISNDWELKNKNVAALTDRGHFIEFDPPTSAIHHEVGKWFKCRPVYRWFGRHLDRMPTLSMRHYVKSKELYSAGLDWKAPILSEMDRAHEIVDIDRKADHANFERWTNLMLGIKERVPYYKRDGRIEKAKRIFNTASELREASRN